MVGTTSKASYKLAASFVRTKSTFCSKQHSTRNHVNKTYKRIANNLNAFSRFNEFWVSYISLVFWKSCVFLAYFESTVWYMHIAHNIAEFIDSTTRGHRHWMKWRLYVIAASLWFMHVLYHTCSSTQIATGPNWILIIGRR